MVSDRQITVSGPHADDDALVELQCEQVCSHLPRARRIEAVNFAASTRRIFRSKDLITSRMLPHRPDAHPDPRS